MVFGSEGEMENNELEEGEACSYNGNNMDGHNYDPDVALAYIGDKLQNVLGHLQKDFEGGVSAEYLGTKFGGYGSFLSNHEQSPLWSQSRSPSEQTFHGSKSPNNFQLEDCHRASKVSLSGNRSLGNGSANSGVKLPDQRGIKVKIKMNRDNLKPGKNAAVYSGLGLDVSPTSSLGDSHSESEALSGELQYGREKSPSSILRVMTSFPLHGNLILSPLPEDMLHLTEKKRPISKTVLASSGGCWDPVKNQSKVIRDKTVKQQQNNNFSGKSKKNRDTKCSPTIVPKKQVDIDALACEELVSNTSKLPLLSDADARKGTPGTSNTLRGSHRPLERNQIRHIVKENVLEPEAAKDKGLAEKVKPESSGSTWKDKKEISLENHTIQENKDNRKTREKTYKSVKGKEMVQMDPVKQNGIQKVASHAHEGTNRLGNNFLSSGTKKKSKGSKTHGTLSGEPTNRVSRVTPFKNRGTPDNYRSKSESDDLKLPKDLRNPRDRYREFFGDINFEDEEEEQQLDSQEFPPVDSGKNFEVAVLSAYAVDSALEGTMSSKKGVKPLTSEAQLRRDSEVAPRSSNLPYFDSLNAPLAPVVIEDNWVQCDKCQKWRLLPVGRNPESLPDKWLCALLDWLPGMNKCSISEEETTKALYALYQVPVPERQNNVHGSTDKAFASADIHPFSHKLQHSSLPEPNGGKKKHKLKPDAMKGEGRARLPKPLKKHIKSSSEGRHRNDVMKSPLVSVRRLQQVSKPFDLDLEKQQHKETTVHMSDDYLSDGGDTKKSNMKRKREHDHNHPRPSKKISVEDSKSFEEGWTVNNRHNGHIGASFGKTLYSGAGKNIVKYDDSAISNDKDYSDDAKHPLRKSKNKLQVSPTDGSSSMKNHVSKQGLMKKRKVNGYATTLPGTRHNLQDPSVSMDGLSDNSERRNRKKARLGNSEGRESITSKVSGRRDKRGSQPKNQTILQDKKSASSQKILDRTNREIGIIQPYMTATSSSSKVSGSQKSRTNFQEVKGSPVESVSSSPIRIVNQDKGLVTRNKKVNDDCDGNGYRRFGSPCKSLTGEDDGSDQLGDVRTEKLISFPSCGVLEPPMLDCLDRDFDVPYSGGTTLQIVHSPDTKQLYTNDMVDKQRHANQQYDEMRPSHQGQDGEGKYDHHYLPNDSSKRKSLKVRPKDKILSVKSEVDVNGKKTSNSYVEFQNGTPSLELKPGVEVQAMLENRLHELENNYVGKKESSGRWSHENCKGRNEYKSECGDGPEVKQDAVHIGGRLSTPTKSLVLNHEGGRSSRRSSFEKTDRDVPVSGKGQSFPLPPDGVAQDEALICETEPVNEYQKGIQVEKLASGALKDESTPQLPKKVGKAANHVQGQNIISRRSTENGKKARDLDAPSPHKRESSSQAATRTLKEAKDLKHLADKLKNSGANRESTGLYFQAVLKFLHAASLIESSFSENARHNEMIQSMQVYSSTAKLCEFCAHEYEKAKDMPSAALAYKCMEVAYMRVVYSSRMSVSRERQELLTALQMVAPGESPSSSISDVDNVNNLTSVDKATIAKGAGSPAVNGHNIIAGRNRTNIVRLLNFTQDVSFAMEASRKCRNAFSAANVYLSEGRLKEGISSVKKALDFNFQDVEGFLRLVKLAMEAISR